MSFHLPNDFKHRNDNSVIEKLQLLELNDNEVYIEYYIQC